MLVTGVGTTGLLQHMTGTLQRHASPQPNIQDHILDYGCNKIDNMDGMLREFAFRPRFLLCP